MSQERAATAGIDRLGVYRLGLMSFLVFQCKRYQGSVGSGAARDFRGAIGPAAGTKAW